MSKKGDVDYHVDSRPLKTAKTKVRHTDVPGSEFSYDIDRCA